MSEENTSVCEKNVNLCSIKDDVDPLHENIMATNLPSVDETESKILVDESKESVAGYSVRNSGKNLNSENKDSSSGGDFETKDEKHEQLTRNSLKIKRKRRRRKSKRSNKYIPNTRTAWKYQSSRAQENRRRINMLTLVPYNTNKFLMEDHMPEELSPKRRTRDSSFSIDSEENYFYSLPDDEEEFLTKEFSSCYEDARVERLEGLSKQQLIQEYLQLQASFDQLSRRINTKIKDDLPSNDSISKIRLLEEKVNQLTSENIELRMKAEISSKMDVNGIDSSEDSESDSSSSSSSCSSVSDCVDYTMVLNEENEKLKLPHDHLTNGDLMDYRTPPLSPSELVQMSPRPIAVINSNE